MTAFKNLFQKFFYTNFDTKLKNIKQKLKKIIEIYYKKFQTFIFRYKIKNRFITKNLILLKSINLNIIIKTFIRNLLNDKIRKKIIRNLFVAKIFLRKLCSFVENTNQFKFFFLEIYERKKNSKIEIL